MKPTTPTFPGLNVAPSLFSRRVQPEPPKPFDIKNAFDRFTLFRLSYLPYVFIDVIWDYTETLMDLAKLLRVSETRKLSRALKELRLEFERGQQRILDLDHRQHLADHAQQFIDECQPLRWAWKVIHSEHKRKNPDLLPDWVMFVAQADLVCAMFAALMRYADHFDKMIADKAGRKMHSILPDEIKRMQGLIPEFMGGLPHARIRRMVDSVLLNDFLTQPLTDDKE